MLQLSNHSRVREPLWGLAGISHPEATLSDHNSTCPLPLYYSATFLMTLHARKINAPCLEPD
jgi:hypothetical protein